MNPIFIAFIVVDILLFIGIAVSVLLNKKNAVDAEYIYLKSSKEVETCSCECCDCDKEVKKETVKEEIAEEHIEEVKEDLTEEADDDLDTIEDGDDNESDEEDVESSLSVTKDSKPVVPFYTKILNADDKIKLFYNEIRNQFKSYRGINARVSKKADSFRKGRELIAKITYTGKTMRVYLKLNPTDYNVNTYHHKDVSDKKSYAEIPLLMRVRSDRSYKYTITLINEMMSKIDVEPKKRYIDVDFIEYLKSFEGLQ